MCSLTTHSTYVALTSTKSHEFSFSESIRPAPKLNIGATILRKAAPNPTNLFFFQVHTTILRKAPPKPTTSTPSTSAVPPPLGGSGEGDTERDTPQKSSSTGPFRYRKGQIIYRVNVLCFLYRSWVIFCPLASMFSIQQASWNKLCATKNICVFYTEVE